MVASELYAPVSSESRQEPKAIDTSRKLMIADRNLVLILCSYCLFTSCKNRNNFCYMPLSSEVLYKIIDKITDFHDELPANEGHSHSSCA